MSRRTTAQRTAIKRAKMTQAETYTANPFADYDTISTPEGTVWGDERWPRWQLETHGASSRLAFNRNRPNHATY
jgi:hypothetical protein